MSDPRLDPRIGAMLAAFPAGNQGDTPDRDTIVAEANSESAPERQAKVKAPNGSIVQDWSTPTDWGSQRIGAFPSRPTHKLQPELEPVLAFLQRLSLQIPLDSMTATFTPSSCRANLDR